MIKKDCSGESRVGDRQKYHVTDKNSIEKGRSVMERPFLRVYKKC